MPFQFEVSAGSAFAVLEGAGEKVMDRFAVEMKSVEEDMLANARARALAHFHSIGDKPGLYLGAFAGGVKRKHGSVIGWIANFNNLAHLLEYGFTISDMLISSDTAMRFEMAGVGELYRRAVHRHATQVQAYPAVHPAFEAAKAKVQAAAQTAAKDI